MRDEYELTDSVQILIDYEYPVRVASVVEWDMNLTYIGDLIACCVQQLSNLGVDQLVGRDCRVDPGAQLIHTVVGDGAVIPHPVRLERCVVLPGATVAEPHDYADTVITPDAILDARHR